MTGRVRSAIGVLGGTFDPVHCGHLDMAEAIRDRLGLGRMILLLSARPPHKRPAQLGSVEHREAMLRLAVEGRSALDASMLELDRTGVGYTIDTLRELRDEQGLAPIFVLGTDSLVELPTWRDYVALLEEFDLVAIDRPAVDLDLVLPRLDPEVRRRLHRLQADSPSNGVRGLDLGRGGRVFHINLRPIAISSSDIRARAAVGLDLTGLVPPAVAGYIQSTGLYEREANR
jgi:nicotinate-nucleotide adenylyltransferase